MIGRLKGTVEEIGEDHCLVDVQGVGYVAFCSARTLAGLHAGEAATLFIETYVREDVIRLYGFSTVLEREWFRLLSNNVQGVGAKVALLTARPQKSLAASADAGAIDQFLQQSAGEIGLTLDRNEARGANQATIAIATAKAPVLTDWLAALEAQGFIIDQLTITPAADGTVGMTAELRKGGQ